MIIPYGYTQRPVSWVILESVDTLAVDVLELMTFLPPTPKYWNDRRMPSRLTYAVMLMEPRAFFWACEPYLGPF